MASTVFYSWQSDLPNATNRSFIQQALEAAAAEIRADESVTVEPVIDRDTAGVPGSPDIASTIFGKVDQCHVFVCDVSIINAEQVGRPTPNPNVLVELGYALKRLGWQRIVMVFNSAFAALQDLPFDLRMRRVVSYEAHPGDRERAPQRRELQARLRDALAEIYRQSDEDEEYSAPRANPKPEDYEWRERVRVSAMEGYSKSGFAGYVEAFATLSSPRIDQEHTELLKAADSAMIRTFGWPIGVMGLNTDHMRPSPASYGICNSVLVEERSYDFWALRRDGCFYMLKTFFEDTRAEHQLFFNSRIVRTAEMLLYLSRLYRLLEAPEDSELVFSLRHAGLTGRHMSATDNRRITLSRPYGPVREDEFESSVTTPLSSIEATVSRLVKEILEPVFMLFDFFEVDESIYDQIVDAFQKGQVT
jgi:hypothetical protein